MLTVIILAAGNGSRMNRQLSKVAQPIAGQPMLKWVYHVAQKLSPEQLMIVSGKDDQTIREICPDTNIKWVCQYPPKGTGDAVKQALEYLPTQEHQVLVLYGDVPFACADQLQDLVSRTDQGGFGLVTAFPPNAGRLGRIIRDKDQRLQAIVEYVDATEAQRHIPEVFSGMMIVPSGFLRQSLAKIQPNNQQKEYYLTDILIEWLALERHVETCIMSPWWRAQGVNTMSEMAVLERAYQQDFAEQIMAQGVKLFDPKRFDCRGELVVDENVIIDINAVFEGQVKLGKGVVIEQNVRLSNVTVGDNSVIKANSVIEDSVIDNNVTVGPFAYVRPGSTLADGSKVGAFVELKKTTLGKNSKANHLSYLGDAMIGQNVNIGAGFISCNYDGITKHQTIIEDRCFIGAGCQLVAPINIAPGSMIGAGTCLRNDVAANTLAVNNSKVDYYKDWPRLKKMHEKVKEETVSGA